MWSTLYDTILNKDPKQKHAAFEMQAFAIMGKIKLNSIELYYEEFGDSGEEVVILLHGFLSSSKIWMNNYIPDLMKRYKVYTIDLLGHGNSNKVKIGCTLKQMADDYLSVCDFKKNRQMYYCGDVNGRGYCNSVCHKFS